MKISQEFSVAEPPDTVWEFFQDVPSVAQCLPGAELLGETEDGGYEGKLTVKLGPMTAAFEGKATVEPNPAEKKAIIEGRGVDKRGGSRGQVKVNYAVMSDGGGSKVRVDADVTLSGPAAQFGRTGLVNEMSKRLIGEFVDCLEARLGASTEEEAETVTAGEVNALALFFSSLWAWVKKLFGRGEQG